MPKPKKQEKKVCNRHIFTLKPIASGCYYQSTINVKMCTGQNESGRGAAKEGENCFEGPIFNQDRNFAMPSFVLSSEKNKYLLNAVKRCAENENKYCNYNDEKSQMLVPKPNSRNVYCNVCKEKYQDYRDHILSNRHKEKIKANSFNRDILEFQRRYSLTRDLASKDRQSTNLSNLIVIDDDGTPLGQPRKMLKANPQWERQPVMESHPKPIEDGWRNFQYFPPPPYCPNYYGGFPALPQLPYYSGQAPFSLNFNYNIHVLGPPMGYMDPRAAFISQTFPYMKAGSGAMGRPNYIVVEDDQE